MNVRADLKKLDEQLQRKDNIIQRYLSNSRMSATTASTGISPEHHRRDSPTPTVSLPPSHLSEEGPGDVLLFEGGASLPAGHPLSSSEGSQHAFSASATQRINQSLGKVLDHLKTKRLESLEFRQMKNVCEELMTRNLHLENNLQVQ